MNMLQRLQKKVSAKAISMLLVVSMLFGALPADTVLVANAEGTSGSVQSPIYNADGTVKKDTEVVQVGKDSAKIQNATFEGDSGTTFNNNVTFNEEVDMMDFIWKKEDNGSLSLAIDN